MEPYFPMPRVLVSRCLGFAACRYNGQILKNSLICRLKKFAKMVSVCPESECGLGVPRNPIRLLAEDGELRVYQPSTGLDVTATINSFITPYFAHRPLFDGAIVKAKSPSCALYDAKIYQDKENPRVIGKSSGIFGQKLFCVFPDKAIEDEVRLTNFVLREHFLIKLFTLAKFRSIQHNLSMEELAVFHATNKLLFLAYNQRRFEAAGIIVANHQQLAVEQVFQQYYQQLVKILQKPFEETAVINTLYHALGWIADQLGADEKQYLINSIEEYRDERIPLQAVTRLLEGHSTGFENTSLMEQTFLQPYPRGILDLEDSSREDNSIRASGALVYSQRPNLVSNTFGGTL